jgi:signal transduction histidine kinase
MVMRLVRPRPEWWTRLRSVAALGAITYGVIASALIPLAHGRGLLAMVLLGLSVAGWLTWLFAPRGARVTVPVGLVVNGVAATALSLAIPHSPAIALTAVAVVRAASRWAPARAIGLAAGLALCYAIGLIAIRETGTWQVIGLGSIVLALLIGLVRRQRNQIEAETEHLREERARTVALDERARVAREIHDVLAHSLAALSVQLETADALLESGRTAQAHKSVLRAGQLAKEGIAEARRAIAALRGDMLPLPQLLGTLTTSYQEDLDAQVTVRIVGEPRELRADVSLTLYRTAQEAITNVRKHAPGAPIDVSLAYAPAEVALAVTNGASVQSDRPLSGAGGGYGLTGLRERAELAGGTMTAAPAGTGWRVDVRIPA